MVTEVLARLTQIEIVLRVDSTVIFLQESVGSIVEFNLFEVLLSVFSEHGDVLKRGLMG